MDILSVSQLTQAIKKQLESRFTALSVRGEISNLKEQSSGHFYFTLKDADSQISAVLFKGSARTLTRPLKSGDQVVVKGELTVYAPRGNYQIIVRELQYAGVGELLLKLHELKLKLEAKGWFDLQRKRPLPKFPRTIGVVTSPTGSVIQDILHVLTRRFSGFHLILNPVRVQGEGAAAEIAQAIEQFNQFGLADVLIVGRGGGSLEDLWPFNEEIVAAAIHASKIPVISAVGHETDVCIADYVADVRAPTPSAAAEIAIAEKAQHSGFLLQTQKRLQHGVLARVREERQRLQGMVRHPLFATSTALLGKHYQLLDEAASDLVDTSRGYLNQKRLHLLALQKQAAALKPSAQILALRQKLLYWDKALSTALVQKLQERKRRLDAQALSKQLYQISKQRIAQKRERLYQLASHLRGVDPRNLLTKGYCILFPEKKDSVILSSSEVSVDQKLRVLLHDGELGVTINEIGQR